MEAYVCVGTYELYLYVITLFDKNDLGEYENVAHRQTKLTTITNLIVYINTNIV